MAGCGISGLVIAPSSQWAAWQVSGPEGVNSRPRYAAYSISKPICLRAIASDQYHRPTAIPTATEHDQDHNDEDKKRGGIHLGLLLESDGPLASQTFKPPGIFSTLQGGGNRRMAIIPNGEICYATR